MNYPRKDSQELSGERWSGQQARLSVPNDTLMSTTDPPSSSMFYLGYPQAARSFEMQNQHNYNGVSMDQPNLNQQAIPQHNSGDWFRQANPDHMPYGKLLPPGQNPHMFVQDGTHYGAGLLQPGRATTPMSMPIPQYGPQHQHHLLSGLGPQSFISSVGFGNSYGTIQQATQPPYIPQGPQFPQVPVHGSVFYIPQQQTMPQIRIPEFSRQSAYSSTPSGSLPTIDSRIDTSTKSSSVSLLGGTESKTAIPFKPSLAPAAGRRSSLSFNKKNNDDIHTHEKQTNFMPTLTKQNANPKINKIVSDTYDSRHLSLQDCSINLEENSLDSLFLHFQKTLGIYNHRLDIRTHYKYMLQDDLEKELFDLFARRVSVFIDIFLPTEVFQKIVCEISLYDETRMIFDAIMCLSSLIYQRMCPTRMDPLTPLKYYQRSVNTIRHHLNAMETESCRQGILARCLLSTNLLCIYELFFVAVDSTYVKGSGSILISILSKQSKSVSLLTLSPVYSSCFWAGFVCDIILSLKLESPCVYCPDRVWKALDPIYFQQFEDYTPYLENQKTDLTEECSISLGSQKFTTWWLHKILLIFSRIIIFANLMEVITYEDYSQNKDLKVWGKLKDSLDEYEKNLPLYVKALVRQPPGENMQFPTIYFKDEQCAAIGINLNLAKLYLYTALTRRVCVANEFLLQPELAKYAADFVDRQARDVAGIMQTYEGSLKLWPINIHALRQASKHFKAGSKAHEALRRLTARVIDACQTRLSISTLL